MHNANIVNYLKLRKIGSVLVGAGEMGATNFNNSIIKLPILYELRCA